jgi:cyclopropane-fatty-acyl-phospholipid synthase
LIYSTQRGHCDDDDGARHTFSHRHSRATDRAAIAFHYDVSNTFYGLWLDDERVYSYAYFENDDDTLEQAQRNKLDHICRKLRLQPGERLLDIGCGWGSLVCWAAKRYGVQAHGITLSERQLEYVQSRIRAAGLERQVTVELRDYRDLPADAAYDKVASVGMFEHVGLANLPAYHATVQRVLRPGGLFLNHGITHDVEGLRPHYALTLRHWVRRLEANREAALREVSEPTYRVWRVYMAACALEFEEGGTGIYQILASKRDHGRWPLPLSRRDLYADRTSTRSPLS